MAYPKDETVSEMCDWVAFTVKHGQDLIWPDYIQNTWKDIRPFRKRYNKAQENSQGVQILWNTEDLTQGKHVILSGSTLSRVANRIELLNWIYQSLYHLTRIDLCIDFMGTNLNPRNATYYLEERLINTHALSIPTTFDKWRGGYTQYIGKKTSETFLRIYDKKSEMGTNETWIRAEIVFSGERANPALKTYLQYQDIRAMVNGFCEFPRWKKWNALMARDKIKLWLPPKETATRAWLMGQVSKSIAKEMALEDSHDFWINFVQKIREEYYALTDNHEVIDW